MIPVRPRTGVSATGARLPNTAPVKLPWPSLYCALLCVYIISWFLQVGYRVEVLGTLNFEFVLGIVLSVISIMLMTSEPRGKNTLASGAGGTGLALIAYLLLFVALSINPDASMLVWWERVFKFSMMALFLAAMVRSPNDLRWVLLSLLVAWGYITLESFRAGLNGSMVWENQGTPRLHGDTPLFTHPNSLAGLSLGVLPFLWFLFPVVGRWLRVTFAVVAICALGCLVMTGSRTGYVGLIAFAALLVLLSRRRVAMIFVAAALLAAVWFLAPESYIARFETMFTGQEIEGASMIARREILSDAIAVFLAHPFGVGVGAFPEMRVRMFGRIQDTHNLYLEVATNIGFIGLALFLGFVWRMMAALRRIWRRADELYQAGSDRSPGPWNDFQLIGATARAVATYLGLRLVLGLFGHDLYEIYWWLSLGLAIGLSWLLANLDPAAGLAGGSRPGQTGSGWRRPVAGSGPRSPGGPFKAKASSGRT